MENKHFLICEASICAGDPNPKYKEEVIWWPGELICKKKPYEKFQKKQIDINYWVKQGKFKNLEKYYTANDLETRSI